MNDARPYILHLGDCIAVMRTLPDNHADAIVTDPPYHLTGKQGNKGFMGAAWDGGDIAHRVEMWAEALRVLKPGGFLLAFSSARTYHRMTCAIEDAGFEIRDQIMWVYASAMPKSLNVSKALDKAAGAEREVVGQVRRWGANASGGRGSQQANDYQASVAGAEKFDAVTAPATDLAKQFQGWGTALKPAHEPVCVARKPLIGTVAANVTAFGTGAINIDACRIATTDNLNGGAYATDGTPRHDGWGMQRGGAGQYVQPAGRWPSNFIHDGSEEVVSLFPNNNPGCKPHVLNAGPALAEINRAKGWGSMTVPKNRVAGFDDGDNLSAARFFYCAKTNSTDRHEGMDHPGPQFSHGATMRKIESTATGGNNHATVKPITLMQYLCRLVTPAGGLILDPFMGSGSTGKAAMREGFQFIGIELLPEHLAIAEKRIEHAWQSVQPDSPEAAA